MSVPAIQAILKRFDVDPNSAAVLSPQVSTISVPRSRAMEIWHQFEEAYSKTDIWPVFVGDDDGTPYALPAPPSGKNVPAEILRNVPDAPPRAAPVACK